MEINEDNFNVESFNEEIKSLNLNNIVIVDNIKLNYSMDEKNPLKFVSLYENLQIVNKDNISFLYPQKFEEKVLKIYIKDKKYFNQIKNIIGIFDKKIIFHILMQTLIFESILIGTITSILGNLMLKNIIKI